MAMSSQALVPDQHPHRAFNGILTAMRMCASSMRCGPRRHPGADHVLSIREMGKASLTAGCRTAQAGCEMGIESDAAEDVSESRDSNVAAARIGNASLRRKPRPTMRERPA